MKHLLLGIFLLIPVSAFACTSDSDCGVGGKCVTVVKLQNGFCQGGILTPERSQTVIDSDKETPVYQPIELNEFFGDRCANSNISTQNCIRVEWGFR